MQSQSNDFLNSYEKDRHERKRERIFIYKIKKDTEETVKKQMKLQSKEFNPKIREKQLNLDSNPFSPLIS
jgi:hypothetical protein